MSDSTQPATPEQGKQGMPVGASLVKKRAKPVKSAEQVHAALSAKGVKSSQQSSKLPAVRPFTVGGALPAGHGTMFKRGSMIGASFGSAVEALWANRLRSLLTMLGIFFGVAAVIAALTLTQGASAFINGRFSSLGTNVLMISNGSSNARGVQGGVGTTQSLTPADANALLRVPHVTAVSPILSVPAQVVFGRQNWSTRIQGVNPDFQTIQQWNMAEGLWFSANDVAADKAVAVLGQTVAANLFSTANVDPVGQVVRVRDQVFRVIGVLQAKGGSFNQDDVVFVPYTTSMTRLRTTSYIDQVQIQVDDQSNVTQVQQGVTAVLEQRHRIPSGGVDDFSITSSNQIQQTAQQATQVLTFLLVGIAAISLTVGGIGIMNIMLVSVTERTREIGIRMSVGARRSDIRNQFLIEAIVLCLAGGTIGLVLGLLVGWLADNAFGLPFGFTPVSIILPFAVSSLIGLIFGIYPAIRASRLDPIVALRTD